MSVPIHVTVLRSGMLEGIPGRAIDVCEGGLGAVLAGEVSPGQTVGVEFQLPKLGMTIAAKAQVRYEDRLRCGLQFLALAPEQQAMIRYWMGSSQEAPKVASEPRPLGPRPDPPKTTPPQREAAAPSLLSDFHNSSHGRERWVVALVLLGLLSLATAGFGWWRWQEAWIELEGRLPSRHSATGAKTQVQVPADVMQKFLVHKVQPVYPEEALQSRVHGTVVLETIIGENGEVVSLHPVSGPDVLTRAAAESLRWWRFEPYKVNGQPVVVQTQLAVEFR